MAIGARAELAKLEDDLEAARQRHGDLAIRAQEIRDSMRAIEKTRTQGADDLRKKLVASLAGVTRDAETVAQQIGERTEQRATVRAKLQDAIRDLEIPAAPAAANH